MAVFDVSSPEFAGDVQKAINYATTAGGGTVYLPHGEYPLTDTLRITTTVTLRGDGPWSSTLFGPSDKEVIVVGNDSGSILYGVVLDGFGVKAQSREKYAVIIQNCWGTSLSNILISDPGVGLYVRECGPLDVMSLYVNSANNAGVFIEDCGSDLFFSKLHVNNGTSPNAKGLWLNRVSGAQFTDCDFIGGQIGVMVDAVGGGGGSDWLKFLSVSCDTVLQDAWHIVRARGLHMTQCWSGSFLQGTGIWIDTEVLEMSIVNHQWQEGLFGIGNNSDSVLVVGGIMGSSVRQPISSTKPGWPKVFGVLGGRSQFTVALRTHSGKYVSAEGGGGAGLIADRDAIGDWETFELE